MINWKKYSHEEIKNKWKTFLLARVKTANSVKSEDRRHITCLEREALISYLISRLDLANSEIDSYYS
jgi:hypothetical protein